MSQGLTYAVDLVLCIDATESMAPVIEQVKRRARDFPTDLLASMERLAKRVTRLRLRVIAFRDVLEDAEPFRVSPFFELPRQAIDFYAFVNGIQATGGGDIPESGLEALAIAMHSDWSSDADKQRHAIVVFTDAPAHPIEAGAGHVPADFARLVPRDLNELTEMWEGNQSRRTRMAQAARRIVVFAPARYPWTEISESWNESILFPSTAGDGLADHEYSEILDMLARSI